MDHCHFRETQLGESARGQLVNIKLDALPGHEFKGHIASISPASGAQFALLPPENATGNFTKITQRIPVKIVIDGSDDIIHKLRPGISAVVTLEHGYAKNSDDRRS